MGKSNQEIEKYTIILVVENLLNLRKNLRKGIGDCKKKKKLVKVKPQHWRIFIIWKRSNKIKTVKTGVTLKVSSLTISNLRTTAFCFENTKLLKQILNNTMSFVIAKNRSSNTKKHFQIQ